MKAIPCAHFRGIEISTGTKLMKASDVFTPQRIPTITLVRDHLRGMKETYDNVIEEGGKLIRVIGPSKSGKTVFIKSAIAEGYIAPITGAGVESTADFWTRALHAVGSDISVATETSEEKTGGYTVGAEIEGGIVIVKGKVNGDFSRGTSSQTSVSRVKAIDLLQKVIEEFADSGVTIFVDDFHYIPGPVQVSLAKQIKQAVENGVRIVAAAVPFRSEDVLRANDDLQGRIYDFPFKYWTEDELVEIPSLGFKALNIECSEAYMRNIAREAAGSPQLMQSLCLETCRSLGVRETSNTLVVVPDDREFLSSVCARVVAAVDFSSTISRMNEGPLTRGSPRKSYVLKDGTAADVYPIIVRALALDPPTLHFTYTDMQVRIAEVCDGTAPHFADPCSHIAKIVNGTSGAEKMDWDSDQHLLSIRDPYLLFGIRWS